MALASSIEVTPQLVRVRGPTSRLQGLDSIPLAPFDLSDVTGSGAYTVPIDTSGLLGASVVPQSATLRIRVEDMVERVFDQIEVQAFADPGEPDVVLDPPTIEVRLTGARTIVTALDPASLRVWIPPELLRGMAPGEERVVRVQIEGVPPFVTALPETDRVTVRRAIDQAGAPGLRDRS
jgi:YbbR domain-containing protein